MKKVLFLLAFILICSAFALKKPAFQSVLNSRGYAGMYIKADTVYIDTTGSLEYLKIGVTDTSKAIYTAFAERISFSWQLSGEDTLGFVQEVACYDAGNMKWSYAGSYGGEPADSVLTLTAADGIEVLTFSACDSIKFITKYSASAGGTDSTAVNRRGLRLQE